MHVAFLGLSGMLHFLPLARPSPLTREGPECRHLLSMRQRPPSASVIRTFVTSIVFPPARTRSGVTLASPWFTSPATRLTEKHCAARSCFVAPLRLLLASMASAANI